jgi:DNA-directed DNA polymerase
MKKRDLMVLAKRLSTVELFSLDIETTGLDRYRDKIVSVQISYDFNGKEYDHFIWWEQYTKEEWRAFLKAIDKLNMVTHNGKFDILFLYVHTGVFMELYMDTQVLAHVSGEVELGLKPLVVKYFGDDYDVSKEIKVSGKRDSLTTLKGFITKYFTGVELVMEQTTEENANAFLSGLKTKAQKNACDLIDNGDGTFDVTRKWVHENRTAMNKLAQQVYDELEGDILITGMSVEATDSLCKAFESLDSVIVLETLKDVTQELVEANNKKLVVYGKKDTRYTLKLVPIFKKIITKYKMIKVYKHEMRAYKAYSIIEKQGIYLDPNRSKVSEQLRAEYTELLEELNEVAEINWNSTQQVAKVLFGKKGAPVIVDGKEVGKSLGLKPVKKSGSGNPSTDDETLVELSAVSEVAKNLREYKRLTKLDTFIKSWDEIAVDGQIHPSFNITARTGRTTCSNPNLQQVPQNSNVRGIIHGRKWYNIIEADYSQLELRVAAEFSGDKNMIHAYQSGSDLHTKTQELMFGNLEGLDHDELKRKRTQAKSCFSGDTEILTDKGFVTFNMYDGVTKVAQYNIESQEISYTEPLDFRMIPNQKICVFENENTSLKLTPNHECIIQVQNGRKYMRKLPFEELAGHGQSKYAWVNAGYYNYDKEKFIEDKLTRFVACFVADGSYSASKNAIKFGFTKKRKIDRFRWLLKELGVICEPKIQGKLKISYFTLSDFKLLNLVKRYCTEDKTLLDPSLTELNPLVYLEEAGHWDGHTNKFGLIRVSSTNKETLDKMQIMALQSGVRARLILTKEAYDNVSTTWELSYNLAKKPLSRFESKDIDTRTHHNANYNVYCVTVPEHNIVIRHNGKVSIQGNCNFGFIYGMQAKSFRDYAKGYGLDLSQEEAEDFRNKFFEAYPTLPTWHKKNINFAQSYGYVESPIGRKRFLRDIWSDDWVKRSSAERQALNSAVQGFGSDCCISAMADIVFSDDLDHSRARIIGTVHDAILVEAEEDYAQEASEIIKKHMENPSILKGIKMEVPLVADVEIGKGWGLH